MRSSVMVIASAFLFSLIGVLSAWGIGVCAPTPATQIPTFERTAFIVMPVVGAVIGWFIGYLATPFSQEQRPQ